MAQRLLHVGPVIVDNVEIVKSLENENTCSSTDTDDEQSVNTEEAFFEMLGLPTDAACMLDVDEENDKVPSARLLCSEQREICVQPIDLPRRCSRHRHPPAACTAFTIDHLLSASECASLIRMAATATSRGFHYVKEASHVGTDGKTYSVQLQNPNPHKLSVFEHPPTVSRLWHALEPVIEPHIQNLVSRINCGAPVGLNPRLRILKYDSSDNDRFEAHFDATTIVGDRKQSLLTVLVYLNDGGGVDFEGGETIYLDYSMSRRESSAEANIVPGTGKVVIFEHDLYHSGAPLQWGTKYVMRTDILFAAPDEPTTLCSTDCDANEVETSHDANTIYDLCLQLGISEAGIQVLDSMDLLQITIDSFLAPGITALKMMLQDGLDMDTVNRLVHAAFDFAKK